MLATKVNCKIGNSETISGKGLIYDGSNEGPLLIEVPKNNIVTSDNIRKLAERDNDLYQLLSFFLAKCNSEREIITAFFAFEILCHSRGTPEPIYGEWVRSLPPAREMNLPSTWPSEELTGIKYTSIYEACAAKAAFLEIKYKSFFDEGTKEKVKEFVLSGQSASREPELMFYDWLLIDQWISSRSLQTADGDLAMVPVIDLCNHAGGRKTNARYEWTHDSAQLLLLEGSVGNIKPGDELFIDYGPTKGAAEFLFNYGFIPSEIIELNNARQLSLPVPVEDDDDQLQVTEETSPEEAIYNWRVRMFGNRRRDFQLLYPFDWKSDFVMLCAAGPELELVLDNGTPLFKIDGSICDIDNITESLKKSPYYEKIRKNGDAVVFDLLEDYVLTDKDIEGYHKLVVLEQELIRGVYGKLKKECE